MTTISRAYAMRLIKSNKAECVGTVCEEAGASHQMFWVINRFDVQRTDHVRVAQLGKFHLPLLGKFGYTGAESA